jgi:ankyrin repeat protein
MWCSSNFIPINDGEDPQSALQRAAVQASFHPLHTAANHLQWETVQVLLQGGADVTRRSEFLETPVLAAVGGCL